MSDLVQIGGSSRSTDWSALRAKLAHARGPVYWRTLEELADTPEFRAEVRAEFGERAEELDGPSRREFLKLASVTLALAGVTACTKQPLEPIIPYVKQPEELTLGKALYFATAMPLSGIARPLLVRSHEGRPTKIEGNAEHPALGDTRRWSLYPGGASDVFSQGSLYDLYDPERSQTILQLGEVRTYANFLGAMRGVMNAQTALKGAGLRILTPITTSPTLVAQIKALQAALPEMKWYCWEPVNRDNVKLGAQQAFGQIVETRYSIANADLVVSLDADFLNSAYPDFHRLTREFADRRDPDHPRGMLRFYSIGSSPTNTSAKADHATGTHASDVRGWSFQLQRLAIGPNTFIDAVGEIERQRVTTVATAAKELRERRLSSLIIPGEHQPPEVHALAHQLNATLGNVGKSVFYSDPVEPEPHVCSHDIAVLMDDIRARRVDLLVILGGNPVYDAPADAGFAQAIGSVPLRVHLGTHFNETAAQCHWHIPEAHYLESWSDARAADGTACLIQPLIAPLYGGKTAHEVLAAFTNTPDSTSYDLVRQYWQLQHKGADFEKWWRRALHDGFIADSKPALKAVAAKNAGGSPASTHNGVGPGDSSGHVAPAASGGEYELIFRPDPTLYDGRFANNAWLQELDKPLSTMTWDNPAWISVRDAEKLKLEQGDIVEIASGGSKMVGPVYVQPGQPEGSVTLFLGGGRVRAGHSGNGAGWNVYPLRSNASPWMARGSVRKTGERMPVAKIQPHQMMEGRDLVRVAALEEYRKNPKFAQERVEASTPNETLYPTFEYKGYAWGMAIDTNRCVGCNSCIVACQAENNIPVVGKKQVLFRRAMHWIRVDTYYEGLDNPKIYFQPLPCMQCENAPCEYVCPVGATVHSTEGLNDMVYNRCVGTRYCSDNCPYKVRRFNFLLYQDWSTPQLKMMRNPDVTVRSRGVMEKCTYCVQRITQARIEAEKAERPVRDGEFTSACAQACPADAIVFGDINDPNSRVHKLKHGPRDYGLLAELGTRPRTTYLAGVTNPNPELEKG